MNMWLNNKWCDAKSTKLEMFLKRKLCIVIILSKKDLDSPQPFEVKKNRCFFLMYGAKIISYHYQTYVYAFFYRKINWILLSRRAEL